MSPRERGPDDFDHEDDDIHRLAGIIERLAIRPTYNEGGPEKSLLKWLTGLAASLLVVSVVGLIGMYGKLSAIEANQNNQQRQIDQLVAKVEALRGRP